MKEASPISACLFCYSSHTFILSIFLRYQLFDGEVSLLTLKAKYDLYLTEMQKFNTSATKGSVLDSFVIHSLMGLPCNAFAVFE